MIKIIRISADEYELRSDDTVIMRYDQTKMRHPDDWIDDAREEGYQITGPYDWAFVDDRDEVN